MAKYLLVYHGGAMPQTKAEQEQVMKAWTGWFGTLGKAVVDGGNPVGKSTTVMPNGSVATNGGANPASGYSILDAKDEADAVKMAKGCPILAGGGSVELAPIMAM
jgi:hypothetical protein